MAKWPLVGYDGSVQEDGVSTRFGAFGGDYQHNATEANVQQQVFDTYTASNMRLYLSSWVGGAGVDDMIATFRTNGADDTQTLTINATGEHEDTSNTDSLVSGDEINIEFDHSAGAHADEYTVQTFQVTLDASSDVPPFMAAGRATWPADNDFAALLGALDDRATETDVEYTMRATRVLRDLRVYASSHTGGSDPAITIRKNQADSSLTVTITSTGEFLDTSNTASYVAGDEANYAATDITTTPGLTGRSVEANTSSVVQVFGGIELLGTGDLYLAPGADVSTATEAEVQIEAEAAATIQNLFTNCTTFVDNNTVISRKNAGDGALTVTVTGTGITEDTTNNDTLAAEDDLSIERSTGASTGTAIWAAVEWETAAITAAVAGTAEPTALESEIVTGGETIIIDLTGDTWLAA